MRATTFPTSVGFSNACARGTILLWAIAFLAEFSRGRCRGRNGISVIRSYTESDEHFSRRRWETFIAALRGFSVDAYRKMDVRTREWSSLRRWSSNQCFWASPGSARLPQPQDPTEGAVRPHLRPWRDGWRHLRFMLMYSPRWLFLYPGIGLAALGVIAMCAALAGSPLHVGVGRLRPQYAPFLRGRRCQNPVSQAIAICLLRESLRQSRSGVSSKESEFERLFDYNNTSNPALSPVASWSSQASLFRLGLLPIGAHTDLET